MQTNRGVKDIRTHIIKARDNSDAWFFALREILTFGRKYKIDRGSYEGQYRWELPVLVEIDHPGNRPLAPVTPEGVPAPTNDDYIDDYYYYLASPDQAVDEEYTYGAYLAPQIAKILDNFQEWGPNTNQLCMTIGGVESIEQENPPCLRTVDLRIEEDQLHFYCYFRSWDLAAGFPSNLGGLQLLKEQMADSMGLEDGTLSAWTKGLHLYNHSIEWAKLACGLEN